MITRASHKIFIFICAIAVAFFILFSRLYYLQIIQGEEFLKRSESNFIQERVIKHSRGKILDSDGNAIADNRLAYDVYVTFAMLPDTAKYLRSLAAMLNIQRSELQTIHHELLLWAEHKVRGEIVLATNVKPMTCFKIEEHARVSMMAGINILWTGRGLEKLCQISIKSAEFPSHVATRHLLGTMLLDRQKKLEEDWDKALKKAQGLGRFKPNLLVSDVGFDAYARIENAISLGSLSGISVVPSQRRRYVRGAFATQTVGYLNQVSIADLQNRHKSYRSGDFIGRSGLEASFEDILRGVDGAERVVVDAKGRRFDEAAEDTLLGKERVIDPIAGRSIKLSIDADLQEAAQNLFLGKSGSVVVMEAHTGFVLAMASFPSFDPNGLVSADNARLFKQLLNDKQKPLRNKAVQDHYMPGSIFKPVTGIAGLSQKLITPSYHHNCTGVYSIHKTSWRCYKREGHGPISLRDSLKASCDGYYYELGHRMGIDALAEVAKNLGLGKKTGIDLGSETSGLVPTKEYYKKRHGFVAPGNVVNVSIGQGDLNVSPIQMAVVYSALVNGGSVYRPQLVREIIDDEGLVIKSFGPELRSSVADASYDFKEIVEGLASVIEPGGSAYSSIRWSPQNADIVKWLNDEKIRIVGKTGTAQVVKLSKLVKHLEVEDVQYEHRDHSWFVIIYPIENPQIVGVVMTEHGGFGGAMSAPPAIRIAKIWHDKNKNKASLLRAGG